MMWMSRSEFDREACFYAVGGVRGSLEWEDFCNMELPVPSPEKQREIVKEYHTIVDRIRLNEQLNKKLEETAQAIYKQWFVDFEFPISAEYAAAIGKPELAGKPYKASGGEMVWTDVLDQEIPKEWDVIPVKDFCIDMKSGGTPNRGVPEYWDSQDVPWLKTGEVTNNIVIEAEEYISQEGFENSSAKILPVNAVLVAMYGDGKTKGQVGLLKFKATTNQACCALICGDDRLASYLFHYFQINRDKIVSIAIGGAQENLSKTIIESLPIINPSEDLLLKPFLIDFLNYREKRTKETKCLNELKQLLLAKMTKMAA
jgi:type I restriction enzyme S subunit